MKTRSAIIVVLAVVAGVAAGFTSGSNPAGPGGQTPPASSCVQPVSWDAWLAAKANAESRDAAGDLVGALQYYLEYVRQAEGLNNPARVAWGKNNAAYMIIKRHRQDQTVDMAPARRLLEEALAIPEAPEDCRKVVAMNLEYVKGTLGAPR
jgi:hypothetical protein